MAYAERRDSKLTGRWVCDAEYKQTDGSVDRWHKAFASKGEAEGAEAYYRATGSKPPNMQSAPTKSYAAAAERFKQQHPEWLAAHDGRTNAQRLRFSVDHLGKLDVNAIRKGKLEEYVKTVIAHAGYKGRPPANRTVNYYLHAVSKVLRDCDEHDELEKGVPTFPYRENSGEDRDALPLALEDAVCAWLAGKGKSGIVFALRILTATGMRGEVFDITPEQIETPEQPENTGIMLSEKQTKTKAARWVPLPPAPAARLRALIARGEFPNAAQVYDGFKAAIKALGESPKWTVYCCRHATITRLLQSGAGGADVAKLTGHVIPGMPKMQLRYYHPDKAHLFSVAKKVHLRFGETQQIGEIVSFPDLQKSA